MYRYDEFDRQLVRERAQQFRSQVERYLAGGIEEDEFKALRLRNGLYLQRHAYMLRVAIPYGVLSSRQLHVLAGIARDYDRGFGHFTTRQNIQFNWPALEAVPDILDRLAAVDMHAIQTSGNAIRNISCDHLAGVAADEIEDPRPWCELIRQWSTLHPEFNWLPRKFKIAVTGARVDRAACRLHDIGLRIVQAGGQHGFQVLVGGGMGRTPVIAAELRSFLPRHEVLSYLEAILRTYNLLGRRDNIHKARIKILVRQMGLEAFRDAVEREWQAMDRAALRVGADEIAAMTAHFATPPQCIEQEAATDTVPVTHPDPEFERWCRHNTSAHRRARYRIVHVCLKAPGVPPGDLSAGQMDALARIARRHAGGELRTSHDQNIVLPHVPESALRAVWTQLSRHRLAHPAIATVHDMICCPGLDYCSLASASSIPVARQIGERFADLDRVYEIGPLQLKISGCVNACAHHHVGHIGILGVDKHGEQWYQITLGGDASDAARIGDRLGAAIEKDRVADVVEALVECYLAARRSGERFLDTYRRIGIEPFREKIHVEHP